MLYFNNKCIQRLFRIVKSTFITEVDMIFFVLCCRYLILESILIPASQQISLFLLGTQKYFFISVSWKILYKKRFLFLGMRYNTHTKPFSPGVFLNGEWLIFFLKFNTSENFTYPLVFFPIFRDFINTLFLKLPFIIFKYLLYQYLFFKSVF